MRHRPIRPNVYLPVVKFGVVSSDWKFVLAAAFTGYTAPFLLDLKLWGAPLELWTGAYSGGSRRSLFQLGASRAATSLVTAQDPRPRRKSTPKAHIAA